MTLDEIAAMAADPPMLGGIERYEDDAQFVGAIFGQPTPHTSTLAQALQDACGTEDNCCCGVACDSDCDCR